MNKPTDIDFTPKSGYTMSAHSHWDPGQAIYIQSQALLKLRSVYHMISWALCTEVPHQLVSMGKQDSRIIKVVPICH